MTTPEEPFVLELFDDIANPPEGGIPDEEEPWPTTAAARAVTDELAARREGEAYAQLLPPLPHAVREVRPMYYSAADLSKSSRWLAAHGLNLDDVGYLIEMSDGRYAAKLYDRDAEGKFFVRRGEVAHDWHCFTPRSPCPL